MGEVGRWGEGVLKQGSMWKAGIPEHLTAFLTAEGEGKSRDGVMESVGVKGRGWAEAGC